MDGPLPIQRQANPPSLMPASPEVAELICRLVRSSRCAEIH